MQNNANASTFRSYLLFWVGQLTSVLGSSIVQFAIIWYITVATESPLILAVASLLGLGTQVLLTPIAGVYADRWNRKAIIGIADFLQALATVALIILFFLNIATVWHILGLLTARGIFQAFHGPTVSAILPSMVPRDQLSRMNSIDFLFSGLVLLIGPVIGAFLLAFWPLEQILWVDVITFIIPVIPLILIRIPSVKIVKSHEEKPSFFKEFREGLKTIRNVRGMVALLFLASTLNFLLVPLSTLLPYFIKVVHLGEADSLALVMASLQGGIIIGSVYMTLKKTFTRKDRMTLAGLYGVFIGYGITTFVATGDFVTMGIGMFVIGVVLPVVNIIVMTTEQTVIPLEMQGRVMAVTRALSSAISPLGMIFAGVFAEFVGVVFLFGLCVALGFVIITIGWVFTDVRYLVDQKPQGEDTRKELLIDGFSAD